MASHPEAMAVPSAPADDAGVPAAVAAAAAASPTDKDSEKTALRAKVAELTAALDTAKAAPVLPAARAAAAKAAPVKPAARAAGSDTDSTTGSAPSPPLREPDTENSMYCCVLSCFTCG